MDLFEQEPNSKRNIKWQGYRQCSNLEDQKIIMVIIKIYKWVKKILFGIKKLSWSINLGGGVAANIIF